MQLSSNLLKIHHIGIAVNSIQESLSQYLCLGYSVSEQVQDVLQNVYLATCQLGNSMIELVAPVNDSSPCSVILKKNGPGPYHICYECSSIENTLMFFNEQHFKYKVISPEKKTTIFKNAKVIFLYILGVGMIELIEYLKNS